MCIQRLCAVFISVKNCTVSPLLHMSDEKSILLYVLVCDKQKRIHITAVIEMLVNNASLRAGGSFIVLPMVGNAFVTAGGPFMLRLK